MSNFNIWKSEEESIPIRMTKTEQEQTIKEIKQISNELLFRVYNRNSHLFSRHIWKSREELIKRSKAALSKGLKDPYLTFSRFTIPTDEILEMIKDHLLEDDTLQKIYQWEPYGVPIEFEFQIGKVIGEGIPVAGDYSDFIDMSNLRILLGAPCYPGRIFSVMSAFPTPSEEEEKRVEENVKKYQYSKERRIRRSS